MQCSLFTPGTRLLVVTTLQISFPASSGFCCISNHPQTQWHITMTALLMILGVGLDLAGMACLCSMWYWLGLNMHLWSNGRVYRILKGSKRERPNVQILFYAFAYVKITNILLANASQVAKLKFRSNSLPPDACRQGGKKCGVTSANNLVLMMSFNEEKFLISMSFNLSIFSFTVSFFLGVLLKKPLPIPSSKIHSFSTLPLKVQLKKKNTSAF